MKVKWKSWASSGLLSLEQVREDHLYCWALSQPWLQLHSPSALLFHLIVHIWRKICSEWFPVSKCRAAPVRNTRWAVSCSSWKYGSWILLFPQHKASMEWYFPVETSSTLQSVHVCVTLPRCSLGSECTWSHLKALPQLPMWRWRTPLCVLRHEDLLASSSSRSCFCVWLL